MKTVTLIHATTAAMPPMLRAMERLTDVHVLNQLDEALLTEIERRGSLDGDCKDRLVAQIALAASSGSDAVLVTCNAYSSVVPEVRARFAPMPIVAIDQPMVDRAVRLGPRIGVLATVKSGLRQQTELIRDTAKAAAVRVEVIGVLREDAFTALTRGDAAAHDRALLDELRGLAAKVDVVVLAQASMARLIGSVPPDVAVPVLASPDLAVAEVATLLGIGGEAGVDPLMRRRARS